MLIQDRIRLILKANKLNASEFADRVGVNRASLSHVMSGRNKPSLDFLAKIITEFPSVNASWLITGETRTGSFEGEEGQKAESLSNTTAYKNNSSGNLVKIVHYYDDNTFKEFLPTDQ